MFRMPALVCLYLLGLTNTALALNLSDEETDWLETHRELRLGVDPSWPPFEFRDAQAQYQGLAADYIAAIAQRLDVKMAPVETVDWTEVLVKAKAGDVDVLPAVMSTPERLDYLAFTRPYLDFPIVILAHQGRAKPHNLEDLWAESGRGGKLCAARNPAQPSPGP